MELIYYTVTDSTLDGRHAFCVCRGSFSVTIQSPKLAWDSALAKRAIKVIVKHSDYVPKQIRFVCLKPSSF